MRVCRLINCNIEKKLRLRILDSVVIAICFCRSLKEPNDSLVVLKLKAVPSSGSIRLFVRLGYYTVKQYVSFVMRTFVFS